MPELTPEEISSCIAALKKLEPGFLPLELFAQIARLVRLPTMDIIPLRWEGATRSLGILQRAPDDLWWPGGWHLPGTVVRSTDTFESATRRLLDTEMRVQHADAPIFRGFIFHQTHRGAEVVLIHTIEHCVFSPASPLTWAPVDALPDGFVESERDVVEQLRESLNHSP